MHADLEVTTDELIRDLDIVAQNSTDLPSKNPSVGVLVIFMLIECKTLYDPRVCSRNIPQRHAIHLCTTRETGKRTLHNWWRISGQQVFYPAITRKTEKEKEGGNSQPSKNTRKGQH